METMTKSVMEAHWDEDAKNYSRIVADELQSFRVAAWQKRLKACLPQGARHILDIGCGPGFFSVILAGMGYQVTAIDQSQEMLNHARDLAASMGYSIAFHKMDIGDMAFGAEQFDAIVSRNVTWTLPNPVAVYEACQRMLRPQGRLLVFDANWQLELFDEKLRARNAKRRQKCMELYGDIFESEEEITAQPDVTILPLSQVHRPYWDVDTLRLLGYREVHADFDLTQELWDEKERLLYGETPLFGVYADK